MIFAGHKPTAADYTVRLFALVRATDYSVEPKAELLRSVLEEVQVALPDFGRSLFVFLFVYVIF